MTIQTEIQIDTSLNADLMTWEKPSEELMQIGLCLFNYALRKQSGQGTIYYDENTVYARKPEKFNNTSWCPYEDCAFSEVNENLLDHFEYLIEEEYGSLSIYEAEGFRGTYYEIYPCRLDDYDVRECFGDQEVELISLEKIVENLFGENVLKLYKKEWPYV